MAQEMIEATTSHDAYPLDIRSLITTAIIGAATGAIGWLLYLAISRFFVEPIFCQSADSFTICRNGGSIAWILAEIMVLAGAVAVMAKLSVYRPLLVALTVFIALWGLNAWLGGMAWYWGLIWHTVLFAVAFATFGWLARANNFIVSLVASLVVVILARVILMLA